MAIARALASLGTVVPILFPLRGVPRPDALPRGARVHEIPLPDGAWSRLALRVRATRDGRHPFLQRIIEGGALDMIRAIVADIAPDAIILTWPFTAPALPALSDFPGPIILDLDTSRQLTDGRRVLAARSLGQALRAGADLLVAGRMERGLWDKVHEIWLASEGSRRDFARRQPAARLRILPNTIAVEQYRRYRGVPRQPGRFVFLGSLDYGPNAIAAERLMRQTLPAVQRSWPGARLVVVGRRPSPRLRVLAARLGVELWADVEDPWSVVGGGPLVSPITSGGGTRLKILEAAASGVPVIATHLAAEGIGFVNEVHFLEREDDASIAAALVELWRSSDVGTRLAEAALAHVQTYFDEAIARATVASALREALPDADGLRGNPASGAWAEDETA